MNNGGIKIIEIQGTNVIINNISYYKYIKAPAIDTIPEQEGLCIVFQSKDNIQFYPMKEEEAKEVMSEIKRQCK